MDAEHVKVGDFVAHEDREPCIMTSTVIKHVNLFASD